MSDTEFKPVNEKLVEKILEQGQKLRNAMVQSILKNDPLNSEIIYDKHFNTPMSSASTLSDKKAASDINLLEAFLNGDYLTKQEEETALNTIRTMSVSDVYKTTEKTLLSKCSCATCNAYNMNNLKCDLRRTENIKEKCISNYIKQKNWGSDFVIKYADTLKVILQSIHLNDLGNKKVAHGVNKRQFSFGINETYFVEYYIPEMFTKELPKSISKIDSGLECNHVRVCARRTNEVIYIRQIFVHSICNLYDCNLEDHNITFFVRYKTRGQKTSELLGVAKFNLGLFVTSKNFSCSKTLPIHLNEESPIIIGTLKVTLQLGSGKIYFGQQFVDAVLNQKVPSDDSDSGEEAKDVEASIQNNILKEDPVPEKQIKNEIKEDKHKNLPEKDLTTQHLVQTRSVHLDQNKEDKFKKNTNQSKPVTLLEQNETVAQVTDPRSAYFSKTKDVNIETNLPVTKLDKVYEDSDLEKELLLGFIYISEAQFLNICPNSYILCQPFCQNGTSSSKVVYNSTNPLYNFCQTVPLLYENNILLKLRENFMIIEFWEKQEQTDLLFGLTRLPLHQFYLTYRNAIILQHLKRNKLPVVGTDWWEPIYSTDNNEFIGQVQVLTALGTEDQILNLELERGFKDDVVKAKFPRSTQVAANVKKITQPPSYLLDRKKVLNKQTKIVYNKAVNTEDTIVNPISSIEPLKKPREPQKFDVGVQSDLDVRMATKDNTQNLPQMQEMLSSFMKLLEQRPVRMENSTNTEPVGSSEPSINIPRTIEPVPLPPPQVRKTSDLLDSLQRALSLEHKQVKKPPKLPSFSAQILINCANQLPSRRKIKSKSKRIKGKSLKQEESVLPSTYVSFETMPGDPFKMTEVFPKSTSPQWNYKCDVNLPMDLLTNGQKRLIFKVWKKCTNAVLQPNMQTDVVLGFAAVDLTVLLAGLPNIQGWFNIVDFSGKCNGQINIHVNPLENLSKACSSDKSVMDTVNSNITLTQPLKPEKEDCDELLSRALKRKFTELDEITQRLRLRLSEVVSEDSEGSNDEIADEFENDINNLCVEEDFDLINFEEEARKFNAAFNTQKPESLDKQSTSDLLSVTSEPVSSRQSTLHEQETGRSEQNLKTDDMPDLSLSADKDNFSDNTETSSSKSAFMDRHVLQGKQRIDTLLEKLSLINAETNQSFSSRYVSGCSTSNEGTDARDIFKNLDEHSRPNIRAGTSFDPFMLQQFYGGFASASSGNLNSDPNSNRNLDPYLISGSETSVITNFSGCRPNPDGQGTNSDEK